MNFLRLFENGPIIGTAIILALVMALTIHEYAHAWTADRFGDDTPFLQGRLTLNPLAHLDPVGSLLFLLVGFGWGKPVVYNPMRLGRKIDELLIALAGPASNLFLALFLNLISHFLGNSNPVLALFFQLASQVNITIAAFNMIPIPPLDGSAIVAYFWPDYRSVFGSQIGIGILLIVAFVPLFNGNTLLSIIIQPIITLFTLITHLGGFL